MESPEDHDQAVEQAADELARDGRRMEKRLDELGNDIESARQDLHNKRNDRSVPGLPPEPEALDEPDAGDSATAHEDDTGPDPERESEPDPEKETEADTEGS